MPLHGTPAAVVAVREEALLPHRQAPDTIWWLVQTLAAHADLARAAAPAGLLSPAEQERCAGLRFEKRRRDWLLGRWTAKQLLVDYVEQKIGRRPACAALTVGSDPDGAPNLAAGDRGLQALVAQLQLTISHSGDRALCALCAAPGVTVGADVERIEARPDGFAVAYFDPVELTALGNAPPATHDTLISAIWSAKEAALKSLRLGLTVDTRQIVAVPSAPAPGRWAGVALTCDPELGAHALRGWWRVEDGYVLTLAAAAADRPTLESIAPLTG